MRVFHTTQADATTTNATLERLIDGHLHHRVQRGSEIYTSAAGPVTVMRTLYRRGRDTAVALPEGDLAAAMRQLVDAELIFRRGALPDATYWCGPSAIR